MEKISLIVISNMKPNIKTSINDNTLTNFFLSLIEDIIEYFMKKK